MSCRTRFSFLVVAMLAVAWVADARASDVPYVSTPVVVIDAMLGIAQVGPKDFLIDLGSGDGRIPITAAKRLGTRGFGVDIDGALVSEAQREAGRQGVADRVEFREGNLFVTDLERATVLTMYLLPSINLQVRPRLFAQLKPGTRVVSHDFDMGNWQPDDKVTVPVPDKRYGPPFSDVYLWVVPADASGQWQWRLTVGGVEVDYSATFEQSFQMLRGKSSVAGRAAYLASGRVRGETVSFALLADISGREVHHEFSGRMIGDTMGGRVTLSGANPAELDWKATRITRGKMDINASLPYRQPQLLIAKE